MISHIRMNSGSSCFWAGVLVASLGICGFGHAAPEPTAVESDQAIVADSAIVIESAPYSEQLTFTVPDASEPAPEAEPAPVDVPQGESSGSPDLFRLTAEVRDGAEVEGSGDGVPAGVNDSPQAVPERGYFPTREEWRTLGGYQPKGNTRALNNPGGPANARNTAAVSGLWPYEPNQNSYFERHDPFFGPVERGLGVLVPDFREGWVMQGRDWKLDAPLVANIDLPFLYRAYNAERATLRLGPLNLDLLSISGAMLYSDYSGNINPEYDETDDWISAIDVGVRAVLQITENMFLSLAGTIAYYPEEGDFGFRLGEGSGLSLGTNARFVYEREMRGGWIFRIADFVDVRDYFADLFLYDMEVDELVQSGRYRFGSDLDRSEARRGSSDFWDDGRLFLNNNFSATFTGPLSRNWMGHFGIGRDDTWSIESWNHEGSTTYLFSTAEYVGTDLRFTPYFTYRISTSGDDDNDWEDFDSWRHTVLTGIRGPITETLRLEAKAGYTWETGEGKDDEDSLLYEMGLIHEFGPYTRHSLFMGNVIDYDVFGDERMAEYMRYTIDQALGPRVRARAFVQGADIDEAGNVHRKELRAGATLAINIADFTRLSGSVIFEDNDSDGGGLDFDRWIYRATLDHRILPGLFGSVLYQYEDYAEDEGGGYFDEHLYLFRLTKTF